ncbi:hypothetical protein N1030_13560 [Desulfovibrio mangrovi]|uniref:tetratricopeptide repeat protein n=1 Tax=Desulfovibrio mangrovi TaxID=2976983 RepID=UPI002245E9F8|nr:hypothetical protein [Desulfovibrio mangrovi]UZP66628.1 hypothetical protein N1030_13560 [Desulfovibrio mangrovi]
MKMRTCFALVLIVLLAACAGLNPNPGERSVDMAWVTGEFERAYAETKPRAEAGEPWAQLRLGIFYENGWGVPIDAKMAEYWYKKAAAQKATGDWADGNLAAAHGQAGYFNQNSDAVIAEYNLANLYYRGEGGVKQDLVTAYVLIKNVLSQSKGESVFFCCEFDGGRYFIQEQFLKLDNAIHIQLTEEQLVQAEKKIKEIEK